MAKLSLWLVTLSRERPFTFLDHAIRVGDSLLGISSLDQIRWLHLDPARGRALHRNLIDVGRAIEPLVDRGVDAVRAYQEVAVVTVQDAEEKRRLSEEADAALRPVRILGNAVVGKALLSAQRRGPSFDDALRALSTSVNRALDERRSAAEQDALLTEIADQAVYDLDTDRPPLAPPRRPLHWPLAFPEIFIDRENPGFDAFVGNPPFLGGKRISGPYGVAYREYLVRDVANRKKGNADLVAYFFLRASALGSTRATVGFLATNTIAQGDTREVGLDQILGGGWISHRAVKSRPWPGSATLEVAQVWLHRDGWVGSIVLDGQVVPSIGPQLKSSDGTPTIPSRLRLARNQAFIGSLVNGTGFILQPDEAEDLVRRDPRNLHVISPYLTGSDLVSSATQSPSRHIINFGEMSLEEASQYREVLDILRQRVKPVRDRLPDYKRRVRDAWWRYEFTGAELYERIGRLSRCLGLSRVGKTVLPLFVRTGQTFADTVVVFAYDDDFHFGVLTSALHWWWVIQYASTMRTDIRYTPTDVFETFPQPTSSEAVARAELSWMPIGGN